MQGLTFGSVGNPAGNAMTTSGGQSHMMMPGMQQMSGQAPGLFESSMMSNSPQQGLGAASTTMETGSSGLTPQGQPMEPGAAVTAPDTGHEPNFMVFNPQEGGWKQEGLFGAKAGAMSLDEEEGAGGDHPASETKPVESTGAAEGAGQVQE